MKYYNHKITYTLNGEEETIDYWNSIEMNNQIAAIVIFTSYFGHKYKKDRLKAENEFAENGKSKFKLKTKTFEFDKLRFEAIGIENKTKSAINNLYAKQERLLKKNNVRRFVKEITENCARFNRGMTGKTTLSRHNN